MKAGTYNPRTNKCKKCPWLVIGNKIKLFASYGVRVYDWRTKGQKISDSLKDYYKLDKNTRNTLALYESEKALKKYRRQLNDIKATAK